MDELNLEFFGICIFGVVVLVYMYNRYSIAWDKKTSTGKAFNSWRIDNPYLYVGTSDVARKLLEKHLLAYDRFLEVDKTYCDNGYRDYLLGLFLELPPRFSNFSSVRGSKRKRRPYKASFFC